MANKPENAEQTRSATPSAIAQAYETLSKLMGKDENIKTESKADGKTETLYKGMSHVLALPYHTGDFSMADFSGALNGGERLVGPAKRKLILAFLERAIEFGHYRLWDAESKTYMEAPETSRKEIEAKRTEFYIKSPANNFNDETINMHYTRGVSGTYLFFILMKNENGDQGIQFCLLHLERNADESRLDLIDGYGRQESYPLKVQMPVKERILLLSKEPSFIFYMYAFVGNGKVANFDGMFISGRDTLPYAAPVYCLKVGEEDKNAPPKRWLDLNIDKDTAEQQWPNIASLKNAGGLWEAAKRAAVFLSQKDRHSADETNTYLKNDDLTQTRFLFDEKRWDLFLKEHLGPLWEDYHKYAGNWYLLHADYEGKPHPTDRKILCQPMRLSINPVTGCIDVKVKGEAGLENTGRVKMSINNPYYMAISLYRNDNHRFAQILVKMPVGVTADCLLGDYINIDNIKQGSGRCLLVRANEKTKTFFMKTMKEHFVPSQAFYSDSKKLSNEFIELLDFPDKEKTFESALAYLSLPRSLAPMENDYETFMQRHKPNPFAGRYKVYSYLMRPETAKEEAADNPEKTEDLSKETAKLSTEEAKELSRGINVGLLRVFPNNRCVYSICKGSRLVKEWVGFCRYNTESGTHSLELTIGEHLFAPSKGRFSLLPPTIIKNNVQGLWMKGIYTAIGNMNAVPMAGLLLLERIDNDYNSEQAEDLGFHKLHSKEFKGLPEPIRSLLAGRTNNWLSPYGPQVFNLKDLQKMAEHSKINHAEVFYEQAQWELQELKGSLKEILSYPEMKKIKKELEKTAKALERAVLHGLPKDKFEEFIKDVEENVLLKEISDDIPAYAALKSVYPEEG